MLYTRIHVHVYMHTRIHIHVRIHTCKHTRPREQRMHTRGRGTYLQPPTPLALSSQPSALRPYRVLKAIAAGTAPKSTEMPKAPARSSAGANTAGSAMATAVGGSNTGR